MATFEVEAGGKTFEIEAPNIMRAQSAARLFIARQRMTEQATAGAQARSSEGAAPWWSRSTGSALVDAAEAGMSGEGGAFADPNATGADIAERAASLASVMGAGAGGAGMAARAAGGLRFVRPAAGLAKDMLVAQGVEEVAKRSGIPGASAVAEVMLGGRMIRSGAPKLLEKSLRAFAERKAAREAAKRVAPAAVRAATTAAAPSTSRASLMTFAKEAASKNPKLGEKIWMLLDDAGAPLRVLTPDQAGAAARAGQATTWVKNLWG